MECNIIINGKPARSKKNSTTLVKVVQSENYREFIKNILIFFCVLYLYFKYSFTRKYYVEYAIIFLLLLYAYLKYVTKKFEQEYDYNCVVPKDNPYFS